MSDYQMAVGSGAFVHVLEPDPKSLLLEDIAHNLSVEPRFSGSVSGYSVAAHSLVVARLAVARVLGCECFSNRCQHLRGAEQMACDAARTGLFHDASEAYLKDIPLDVKAAMRVLSDPAPSPYDVLEERFMRVLATRYNLPWHQPWARDVVKDADRMALSAEVEVLWPEPMRAHFSRPEPTAMAIALVKQMVRCEISQARIESWFIRAAAGLAYGYSPGLLPCPS